MVKYIISDQAILGGMPVIKGARVPVARILSLLKEGYTLEEIHELWWSQKSRQFVVENKTKHNHSRKFVLSARIDLRWRVIVQRLMKPLMIVKREVRSQIAHGFGNALVIFDVDLLVFDTAP